jgi:hypothetical protein
VYIFHFRSVTNCYFLDCSQGCPLIPRLFLVICSSRLFILAASSRSRSETLSSFHRVRASIPVPMRRNEPRNIPLTMTNTMAGSVATRIRYIRPVLLEIIIVRTTKYYSAEWGSSTLIGAIPGYATQC